MQFCDILAKRRTVRFFQQKKVEKEKIISLLNAARLSSCAMNKQILRYAAVTENNMLKRIFDGTAWAAKVQPRRTPVWGETAPACFVVVHGECEKTALFAKFDVGAAVMSMEFQAQDLGLGCCWLGSFDRQDVHELLQLGEDRYIYAVVAVGYPAEEPKSEDIELADDQSYYIDDNGVLTVPKYTVEALTEFYEG